MTIRLIFAATLIAGTIATPARAQLPRPSVAPPAAQKGMAPGPGAQKGVPQQQTQPQIAPPAPYAALKVSPPKPHIAPKKYVHQSVLPLCCRSAPGRSLVMQRANAHGQMIHEQKPPTSQ